MKKNKKVICLVIISAVLTLLAVTLSFVLVSLSRQQKELEVFTTTYPTTAMHGYYAEILGTYPRQLPVVKDEGLPTGYPVYGRKLNLTTEQKNAILAENSLLCAGSISYQKMDAAGYLYLSDGTPVLDNNNQHRRLYKHTAAVGMYYGNIDDHEPAVIKRLTLKPRLNSNSYSVTGLYAPAGEVVKLEMLKEDFLAASKNGGITVHIGQALYNGQANNIWNAKDFNRMPVILNTMSFNTANATYDEATQTYTCYVGSYLGGPIYIRSTNARVTVTISGAVEYRHFILGYTTPEEYARLSKSSVPFFDLEIWDNGVLHSGPLIYAQDYSYEDLYRVAILWEKIALVSTRRSGQGVVFLYDPFVAAGAAVAFPGRSSVNNPASWMKNALNYNSIVTSGCWGVLHEYNHNFQGWGLPGGGEVTNNALNLVSYSQFTKISAARTLTTSGESGMSGWNRYTSASFALRQVLNKDYAGTNQLSIYATLLHNLGAKDFMAGVIPNTNVANYYKTLCEASGYDLTYFFKNLINQDPGSSTVAAIAALELPQFVPVASIYQTGRSVNPINNQKQYIQTMQPFVIPYGQDYTIDLRPYTTNNNFYQEGSIILPDGFSYRIKKITQPQYGALEKISTNIYKLKPDAGHLQSGKIYVTLEITKDDQAFMVDDVELVLEFTQTHEIKKNILERTVYTYAGNIYTTATEAYENNYENYLTKVEEDNINPTQNSNTEIWVPNPANNAVMEIKGKIYVATDGDYKLALRGRHHCAVYTSFDNQNFTLAASLDHNTNKNDWWTLDTSFCDFKGLTEGTWLYFKAVLVVDYNAAFIGLGWGKYEVIGAVLNESNDGTGNGNEYLDANGNPLSDEDLVFEARLNYANAYRNSYQFDNTIFESDYLFTRRVNHNYSVHDIYNQKGILLDYSGYTPWFNAGYSTSLNELFDDNESNYIHSAKGPEYDISDTNPFMMLVDLENEIVANKLIIYGESTRAYQPKDFILYIGNDPDNLQKILEVTDAKIDNHNITVTFKTSKFRYYKFVCTRTNVSSNPVGSRYIAFRGLKFGYDLVLNNGTCWAPDTAKITYRGSWQVVNKPSTFGRVYVGQSLATAEFEFNGTYFAIMSYQAPEYGCFEVYIDGKFVKSIDISNENTGTKIVYRSDELVAGKHVIKLICKNTINLDAVITW